MSPPAPSQATVRRAAPDDAARLARLAEATFRETFVEGFAVPYPAEDLAVFVPQTYGEDAMGAMLADPAYAVWIAERRGVAVGYAAAGPCSLPYDAARAEHGELKRLYVRRGEQGSGLGPRLMETALDWLERDGARPLWIGVWSGNAKALGFYARYGFSKFGEHVFHVGRWRDDEVALRRG